MELREYLEILLRRWPIWATLLVVGVGLGVAKLALQPVEYESYASISIIKNTVAPAERTADFQFDNFYALQSSQLLTQMAAGWLADAVFVADIYRRANIELPDVAIGRYQRLISTASLSGPTFQIATRAKSLDEAIVITATAQTMALERLESLKTTGVVGTFQVLSTTPIAKKRPRSATIPVGIGAVAGGLFGLITTFVVEGLKKRA